MLAEKTDLFYEYYERWIKIYKEEQLEKLHWTNII
jgi:hypothetical protein